MESVTLDAGAAASVLGIDSYEKRARPCGKPLEPWAWIHISCTSRRKPVEECNYIACVQSPRWMVVNSLDTMSSFAGAHAAQKSLHGLSMDNPVLSKRRLRPLLFVEPDLSAVFPLGPDQTNNNNNNENLRTHHTRATLRPFIPNTKHRILIWPDLPPFQTGD